MNFDCKIDMENTAFDSCPEGELNYILKRIGEALLDGLVYGPCVDVDGNTVGHWKINTEA